VANSLTFKIKIDDEGTMTLVTSKAKKAADGLKKVDEASKSASASSDNYSKKQKGVAGATSNSTKAFSKMTRGITSGIVPAYAALAANIFALSAAYLFLKNSADVRILEQSQISYAATTGIALQSITGGLREVSGGMLDFRHAAEAAAIGMAKGFSAKQLEDLAIGARKASAALGRDFGDAFDRLIRGVSKAEPELLDELGITLKLTDATQNYARMLNVSVGSLTASQRSTAVLIETQRQLNDLYGDAAPPANPFIQLSVTFDDLIKKATNFLLPVLSTFATIINTSALAAVAVFGALGVSLFKLMFPLDGVKERLKQIGVEADHSVALAMNTQMDYTKEIKDSEAALEDMEKAGIKASAAAAVKGGASPSSKLIQKSIAGEPLDRLQQGRLRKMLDDAELQYKLHGEITKNTFKGVDIEIVRSFKNAMDKNSKAGASFFDKTKVGYNILKLTLKKYFSQIASVGARSAKSIQVGFERAGKAIGTAMKFAGVIGALKIVYDIIMKVARSPFTIITSVLDAVSGVLNLIGPMLGETILMPIAKIQDFVINTFKGIINVIIAAYNKARGVFNKEPISFELEADSTYFQDSVKKMAAGTLDLGKDFKSSSIGVFAYNVEAAADVVASQETVFESANEKIILMGKDLNNTVSGLTDPLNKATEAQKGFTRMSSLSSLGISDQIKKMNEMTSIIELQADGTAKVTQVAVMSDKQKQDALNSLMIQMTQLGKVSKPAQKQLALIAASAGPKSKEYDAAITALIKIEETARTAGTSYKAMLDQISTANAAMSSGDLVAAEKSLAAMTAEMTASKNAYTASGEIEAATKVQENYNEAVKSNAGNTGETYEALKNLREAQEAHTLTMSEAYLVQGSLGALRKTENDIISKTLELKALEIRDQTAMNDVDKDALNLKIALNKEATRALEISKIEATQGKFAADAARTGDLAASTAKTLGGDADTSVKIGALQDFVNPMTETMKTLGPDGEATAIAIQGSLAVAGAWTSAFESINVDGATSAQKTSAILGAVGATVNQLSSIMAASSRARVAGVDAEIKAEQARDGKSAESVAKIKGLEKKKEAMQRKAFEVNKKMQIASAIISTASAAIAAFSPVGGAGPLLGGFLSAAIIAMGAAQVAMIAGTSFQGGASSVAGGEDPSKASIGNRQNSVDLAKARSPSGELAYARGAQGVGSGMTNYTPVAAFAGTRYRAAGGNTSFMVGEQGPELFTPEVPGRISPADESSMGGAPVNVTFTINAIDSQGIEDVLNSQRGNLVGIIREAANAYGESFLENVNVESYQGAAMGGGGSFSRQRTGITVRNQ
jgi:hypothetical protein